MRLKPIEPKVICVPFCQSIERNNNIYIPIEWISVDGTLDFNNVPTSYSGIVYNILCQRNSHVLCIVYSWLLHKVKDKR